MKTFTNTLAILAFGGYAVSALAEDATTTTTTTAVATPAAAPATNDVGISSRDGITVSGTDTLVTRNGVTEKISNDLKLDNGMRIKSDGTVVAADGGTFQLRASQVLSFDGRLINAPVDGTSTATPTAISPSVTTVRPDAVATRTDSVTTQSAPSITTPGQAATKEAADISAAEAQRRAQGTSPGAAAAENTGK